MTEIILEYRVLKYLSSWYKLDKDSTTRLNINSKEVLRTGEVLFGKVFHNENDVEKDQTIGTGYKQNDLSYA